MKNQLVAILALLAAAAALLWHALDRPAKIAYAETAILMSEFSEAIKARHKFEEAQKEWDANLKRLNDSVMASMERLKAEYDKAQDSEKKRLRSEFEKWNGDYQRYVDAVKAKSQEKEKELMEPVIKKINSFLDLWGKQHGYDMIFGTMTGGSILQADAARNVTAAVLKAMNDQYRDLPTMLEKESVGDSTKVGK